MCGGECTERHQRETEEEAGAQHRRGERERAEREDPRRRCEAGERLRDSGETEDAPRARHRKRHGEVGDRLEEPRDAGADEYEEDVPALDAQTGRRRDPPEGQRNRERGERADDARLDGPLLRTCVERERPRFLELRRTDERALSSIERVGE